MLRFIALWSLLLLALAPLSAQFQIEGQIKAEDGDPLVGVNVLIYENKAGAVTNEEGFFRLKVPANLKVLHVEFSFIGFRTQSRTIDLNESVADKSIRFDIVLVESPLEMQEITVTAGIVKRRDEVSFPIETLQKKDLLASGEATFSRALARTPGVYFSNFGLGGGQPIIRGLSNTNLVVLNNGIKQEAFQFSSNHPFLIDEWSAAQVEIIKGPASLQYGSDAVGGVINVIRELPAKPQAFESDFISQYHSNTNGFVNSLGLKGSVGKLFLGVRGSIKSHEDFSDGDDQTVDNTRVNEASISLNSGLRTDYGLFTLNYNYTGAKYGIQNDVQLNLFASPLAPELLSENRSNEVWYQDLTNHLISSNNTLFLGKNTLSIDLGYQANTRELVAGGINPQQQLVTPTVVSMQLNTFTYNTKFTIPTEKHNFVLGINGALSKNEADESKPNIPMPDAEISDIGLYAIGDFQFTEHFRVTSGLRYDYRNMQSFPVASANTDRFEVDKTYNNLNGSVGFAYNFSDNQFLKANIARDFRSPNIPELTQNGIHGGRFERGDPNLDAQSNIQFDLTYHYHSNWATLTAAPFYNAVNNYIYVVMTNEAAPIGGGPIFQHVQNDARLWGGELALDIHPLRWLGVHGSYSMIRADITDDTEGVDHPTFTPQDRLTTELKVQRDKLEMFKRPYASVEFMHFFEQTRTGQNEAATPAYGLLNAKVGLSYAVAKRTLDFYIVGNNLANESYIDHLSITRPLGLQMIGRNIMVGVHFW